MKLHANWNYPTAVRMGAGRLKELGEAAAVAGIARPLIVTDRGLVKLPMIKTASEILVAAKRPTQVFSDVKPNPGAATIEAGLEALRGGKHDGVVAIGGGSALDAGKVIAFMAGQTRPKSFHLREV